jgi:translocator protein
LVERIVDVDEVTGSNPVPPTMKILKVILSIAVVQLTGIIGSVFTTSSIDTWFTTIVKPEWNPPSWVFGPVWIALYTLMGIASFLVWQKKELSNVKIALSVYGVQLVLNALWSILFFGLKNPGLAFAEIIVLLIFIIITTILFWRINTVAGILMLPYIAWVTFATFLNYTIWQLN